jgi:hypothetical protein
LMRASARRIARVVEACKWIVAVASSRAAKARSALPNWDTTRHRRPRFLRRPMLSPASRTPKSSAGPVSTGYMRAPAGTES